MYQRSVQLICATYSTKFRSIIASRRRDIMAAALALTLRFEGRIFIHAELMHLNGSVDVVGYDENRVEGLISGSAVNFKKLFEKFVFIIGDYDKDGITEPRKYLEYMCRVIYQISPEARKVRRGGKRVWSLVVKNETPNGEQLGVTIIETYKDEAAHYVPSTNPLELKLTVKLAGCLAIMCLERYTTFVSLEKVYLTPLSSAAITTENFSKFREVLGYTNRKLYNIINSSTQSGGYLLPSSTGACRLAAAYVAVRNFLDNSENEKRQTIEKTRKQYTNARKIINR